MANLLVNELSELQQGDSKFGGSDEELTILRPGSNEASRTDLFLAREYSDCEVVKRRLCIDVCLSLL